MELYRLIAAACDGADEGGSVFFADEMKQLYNYKPLLQKYTERQRSHKHAGQMFNKELWLTASKKEKIGFLLSAN